MRMLLKIKKNCLNILFEGVTEVQPRVLIIGSSGRCGSGAAYILERVGLPRLVLNQSLCEMSCK